MASTNSLLAALVSSILVAGIFIGLFAWKAVENNNLLKNSKDATTVSMGHSTTSESTTKPTSLSPIDENECPLYPYPQSLSII